MVRYWNNTKSSWEKINYSNSIINNFFTTYRCPILFILMKRYLEVWEEVAIYRGIYLLHKGRLL